MYQNFDKFGKKLMLWKKNESKKFKSYFDFLKNYLNLKNFFYK